ncbi:MAG: response regulator [Cyclobacteriaceae bacterium]
MKFKNLKALVVDDDQAVRLIVSRTLASIEINCEVVSDGTKAIEKLSKENFDFIIMDVRMPEQDGLDAVRWIRDLSDVKRKNMPIFALTNYSTGDHTKEILEAGYNAHLVKPLDLEELTPLLEKYFGQK